MSWAGYNLRNSNKARVEERGAQTNTHTHRVREINRKQNRQKGKKKDKANKTQRLNQYINKQTTKQQAIKKHKH